MRAECGDTSAALWLQCGGGGVRLWLAAINRAFPENGSVPDEISWVEPSDAALAPVLAALWRLALATPRGERVDKPTLHATLRYVVIMAANNVLPQCDWFSLLFVPMISY